MAASDKSSAKNFDFSIISQWRAYNSANDKTNLAANIYVGGSLNMFKKLNGNIGNRPGQQRIGAANTTLSPVSSEFVWNTSWGATLPVWVTNNTLQVSISNVWYTLLSGLTKTRYVFDKWYDQTQAKDSLLFVNGDSNLYQWSGGNTTIASGNNSSGAVVVTNPIPANGGTGYTIGDVITLSTTGTGAMAKVTALGSGAILTSSLLSGGTKYLNNSVYSIIGGNNATGGLITTTAIGTAGDITTYNLTAAGTGFVANNIYAIYQPSQLGQTAYIKVLTVAAGGTITGFQMLTPGSGYATGASAVTGGTGTSGSITINGIAQGSIIKSGSTTFQQDGFASSGSIIIGSTTYTYAYNIGNTLAGVTPDPTGVSGIGLQTVVTYANLPGPNLKNDFIKVINNQAYIGSYTSRIAYASSKNDYTNYVVPSFQTFDDPVLLTMDSTLNGIGVKAGKPYISYGSGEWAQIDYQQAIGSAAVVGQRMVNVQPYPVAKLAAAYAHEFIGNVGDNIIYLSKDQQLRTLGNFNDAYVNAYPSLSQEISTELSLENFTGGGIKCAGDFTYLTSPVSGKTYLYQVRQEVDANNQIVTERLWHSPFTWNATRVDEINGTIVAFSNANPQVYSIWTNQYHDDSPSGQNLPYPSILALSYNTNGRRQGLQSFDKVFTEGYTTEGSLINLTVNYNYEGATGMVTVPINSIARPAYLFTSPAGSFGDTSLGDKPLGNDIFLSSDLTDYPKFKNISSLALTNCFEYQLVYSSDTADAQWEILASGTNTKLETEQESTFLINKLRPH